ncbi:HD domain-containing protein [Leptothoe sp. PORK10 BA2]|uniref:HD domain-containing protein n=1 Tax=Leptothoe sp. PORK10 BA2 TaxID=3110254 RepID=UPI002B1F648C|nr:hypothetical protein [Leptothoe sp. PORK10 BA2]MEA5462309.1 hypothetical protein [Leptothoe sp. PORK10 BA2]
MPQVRQVPLPPLHTLSLARWGQLCQAFNIHDQTAIEQEFNRIATAYGQPQRAYHTAQHINECLAWLDWTKAEISAEFAGHLVLEMALWYHDVVYQTQGSDPEERSNERQSADQAVSFLQAHLPSHPGKHGQIHRVEALIMATVHLADQGAEHCPDSGVKQTVEYPLDLAPWMMDIDLAILGADPQRFNQYETQIRQEYAWVPEAIYRTKRQQVLKQFLARPVIYHTPKFQQQFESQARRNLGDLG